MQRRRINLAAMAVLAAAGLLASPPLFAAPSHAKSRGPEGDAIGLFLGQPTGITYRHGLGDEQSFEAKAAWNLALAGGATILVQTNWLIEFPGLFRIDKESFPLYIGAGFQAELGSGASLGLRMPLGIAYRFSKAPLELCLELGPGMQVLPATSLLGSGGVGIRYRF
jgi:hypothetical protein